MKSANAERGKSWKLAKYARERNAIVFRKHFSPTWQRQLNQQLITKRMMNDVVQQHKSFSHFFSLPPLDSFFQSFLMTMKIDKFKVVFPHCLVMLCWVIRFPRDDSLFFYYWNFGCNDPRQIFDWKTRGMKINLGEMNVTKNILELGVV